jgi:hypothetical protein
LRFEIGQADSCVPKLELQNAAVGRAGRRVDGQASGWLQCNYELMADMYDARLNEQPAPACAHVKHTLSESGRRRRLPPWLCTSNPSSQPCPPAAGRIMRGGGRIMLSAKTHNQPLTCFVRSISKSAVRGREGKKRLTAARTRRLLCQISINLRGKNVY